MRRVGSLLLLFCCSFLGFSQDFPKIGASASLSDSSLLPQKKIHRHNPVFVEDLTAGFTLAPEILFPHYELRIEPRILKGNADSLANYTFMMQPNLPSLLGGTVGYRELSLSYAFRLNNDIKNDSFGGESSYFGLSLKFQAKGIYWEGLYRDISGFTDRNSFVRADLSRSGYTFNTDFRSQYLKFRARHFFVNNDKFSYAATYNFSERQLKTAFAVFWIGHSYFHNISSNGRPLNNQIDSAMGQEANVIDLNVAGLGVGPGVAVNLVFLKRCFIAFSVALGADVQRQHYSLINQSSRNKWMVAPLADSRFGLGYNAKRFFAGVTVFGDQTSFSFQRFRLVSEYLVTTLTIGIRLPSSNWLDKWYYYGNQKMKETVGFGVE